MSSRIPVTNTLEPGHCYPVSEEAALQAVAASKQADLFVYFVRMIARRTQPLECQRLTQTVAVMAAVHNLGRGWDHPRTLVIYQVPVGYQAVLSSFDAEAVHGFLRDWVAKTPTEPWQTWAMFLMAGQDGKLVRVPVQRPSLRQE